MSTFIGRSWMLILGLLITGVPSVYYGIDTIVTLHMIFVPLATILLFSRKEKKQFLANMGVIMMVFLMVILWNAVAGVIGNKKFSYDLWGDSVNIASRFEASGHPEKIHITEAVKNNLGDNFLFEDCGEVMIKGKGLMKSYFLIGKKDRKDFLPLTINGQPNLAIAS